MPIRKFLAVTILAGWFVDARAENPDSTRIESPVLATVSEQQSLSGRLLPAESPALRERMRHPERLFLWEGAETVGPGEVFYVAPEWSRRLSRAGWIEPETEWRVLEEAWAEGEPSSLAFQLQSGAEVGDGLYREMQGQSRNEENRTPAYLAWIEAAPQSRLRVRSLIHQNDVATYRTFSRRSARVESPGVWGDLAYQGENLPTRSMALAAMEFDQRHSRIGAAVAYGWRWSLSPITGSYHPWVVTLSKIHADWNDFVGVYLDLAKWETPAAVPSREGEGSHSEVGLKMQGDGEGWKWRFGLGVLNETWQDPSDSGLNQGFHRLDEVRYPFALEAERRLGFSRFPSLQWKSGFRASSRSGLLSAQGDTRLGLHSGRHRPGIALEGYGVYRSSAATVASEWRLLPDTSSAMDPGLPLAGPDGRAMVGEFLPVRWARGAAGVLEYGWVPDPESAAIQAHFATDWGRPVFEGLVTGDATGGVQAVMNDAQGNLDRVGRYVGSGHALHNVQVRGTVVTTRLPRTTWSATAGARIFFGREASRLEYEPAPYWFSSEWTSVFPTDLSMTALMQFVGPKTVRGFTIKPWRSAPHLESQLALRQAFLRNRMGAHAQFLHAFGREWLEHPTGNPLRFRVRIGMDGRW